MIDKTYNQFLVTDNKKAFPEKVKPNLNKKADDFNDILTSNMNKRDEITNKANTKSKTNTTKSANTKVNSKDINEAMNKEDVVNSEIDIENADVKSSEEIEDILLKLDEIVALINTINENSGNIDPIISKLDELMDKIELSQINLDNSIIKELANIKSLLEQQQITDLVATDSIFTKEDLIQTIGKIKVSIEENQASKVAINDNEASKEKNLVISNQELNNSDGKAIAQSLDRVQGINQQQEKDSNSEGKEKAPDKTFNVKNQSKDSTVITSNDKDNKMDLTIKTNNTNNEFLPIKDVLFQDQRNISTSSLNKLDNHIIPKPFENILTQITEGANITLTEETSEMVLRLKPDNLGNVSMKIVIERGMLIAQFDVESQIVKQAIEANLEDLRTSLNDKGLQVQELNVSVNKDSKKNNSQFNFNKRSKSKKIQSFNAVEKTNYFHQRNSLDGVSSTINFLA